MQPAVLLGNYTAFSNAGFDARVHFIDANKQEEHISGTDSRDKAEEEWNTSRMKDRLVAAGNHLAHLCVASGRLSKGTCPKSLLTLIMDPLVKIIAKELKVYCDLAAKKLGPLDDFLKKRLPKRM